LEFDYFKFYFSMEFIEIDSLNSKKSINV